MQKNLITRALYLLLCVGLCCSLVSCDWLFPEDKMTTATNTSVTNTSHSNLVNLFNNATDPEEFFLENCIGSGNVWERTSGGITFDSKKYKRIFASDGIGTEFFIDGSSTYVMDFQAGEFHYQDIAVTPDAGFLTGTIASPDSTPITYSIQLKDDAVIMTVTHGTESVVFTLKD